MHRKPKEIDSIDYYEIAADGQVSPRPYIRRVGSRACYGTEMYDETSLLPFLMWGMRSRVFPSGFPKQGKLVIGNDKTFDEIGLSHRSCLPENELVIDGGLEILRLRKKKGLKQIELARLCKYKSTSTLWYLEHNKQFPRRKTFKKIMKVLEDYESVVR